MGIFQNIINGWGSVLSANTKAEPLTDAELTAKNVTNEIVKNGGNLTIEAIRQLQAGKKDTGKKKLKWVPKAASRTVNDMKKWKNAEKLYCAEDPKSYALELLFNDILNDALLTSQIENRNGQLYGVGFSLKKANGEVDEEQTDRLKQMPVFRQVTDAILDSRYRGHTLGEFEITFGIDNKPKWVFNRVPGTNVVGSKGLFFPDYTQDTSIPYRELAEFGKWIVEFQGKDLMGLLNKAVPHVLIKKFAHSCWSELCEIYGIPPRVLKTNTQDTEMLNRAEKMMQDMGAAAWWIIDQTEAFEFAKGVDTSGDVFENLIKLCNNELSLLISGAVIGQDTKNGSNAKEQSSQDLLAALVKADLEHAEQEWNSTVIPAMISLGWLSGDIRFEFDPVEDISELFNRTKEIAPYYHIDTDWMRNKFGIEVTEPRAGASGQNLNADDDFFV